MYTKFAIAVSLRLSLLIATVSGSFGMDEVDTPQRPRRPRAKNSFQMEIESKLKERRAKGLVTDLTSEESEEDGMNGKYCCFCYLLCAVLISVLYFLLERKKKVK